jgi:hypothetical protein
VGGEAVGQSGEEEKREKVDDDDDDDDDGGVPCFGVASGGGALATSSVSPIAAPRPVGDDYQGHGRNGMASLGVSLTGSATAAAAAAVLGLSGASDTGVGGGGLPDGVEGCGQAGGAALTEELAEVRMRQQAQHDAQVMSAAAAQEKERKETEKEKEKEKDREAAARAIAAAASSLSQPRHHAPDLDAAPPIQPRPRTGSSATGSRASQNTPSPTGDAPPQVPQLVLPGISASSRPSTDDSGHRSTRSTPTFEALTSDRVASLVALNSNKMPGVGAAPLTDRARPPSSAPDLSRGKTPRAPLSAREATNNTGGGGGGDSIADALEGVRKGDRTGAVWKIVSGVRRRLRKGNGGAMW